MLEKSLNDVIDIIHQPEIFYKEAHQKIYAAIQELFSTSESIDILTVTQKLKSNGDIDQVGGAFYISQLTNRVASAAHAEAHARILVQKFILREMIRISGKIIQNAYDETTDVFNLLDEAESELFKVAEGKLEKIMKPWLLYYLKLNQKLRMPCKKKMVLMGLEVDLPS